MTTTKEGRWTVLAPLAAQAVLRAIVYDERGRSRFVRSEWPWGFHGGKSYRFATAHGAELLVGQATHHGSFVISVFDDREGLVARIEEDCGLRGIVLDDIARVTRRYEQAATDGERIAALFGLVALQSVNADAPLPALELATRRALDDANPVVRLAGVRATAALPTAAALALLDGGDDPDNPGLTAWRDHYRSLLTSQTSG